MARTFDAHTGQEVRTGFRGWLDSVICSLSGGAVQTDLDAHEDRRLEDILRLRVGTPANTFGKKNLSDELLRKYRRFI